MKMMDLSQILNTTSQFSTVQPVRSITAPRRPQHEIDQKHAKTFEKANELILGKTARNDTLKFTYIPLMLVDSAIMIFENVRDAMALIAQEEQQVFIKWGKASKTKQLTVDVKQFLEDYEHQLLDELGDTRWTLKASSEEFYERMVKSYRAILNGCTQKIAEEYPKCDKQFVSLVASCHLVKILLEYKEALEKKYCDYMQSCLKDTTLAIKQRNPIWHNRFKSLIIRTIELVEMPVDVDTETVRLYIKVMDDKIQKMDLEELTEQVVELRAQKLENLKKGII